MAGNALDGPGSVYALLMVNAQTGLWELAGCTDISGKPALNVNVVATVGGGGGGGAAPSTTATQTVVTASGTSVQLLASNSTRLDATFYNNQGVGGASSLYLSLGSAAGPANFSYRVPPNETFVLPIDYTGAVFGYWDNGATGNAAVTEFTP